MAESAKETILARVTDEGYTDSYGMLLYLTAVIGLDPMMLDPESNAEFTQWRGHFDGLRASLLWLAMHERRIEPDMAAYVVDRQIREAAKDVRPGDSAESRLSTIPYWSRNFKGLPEHLSEVRKFARSTVGDCQGADVVELVASELAGNAIQHSESGKPAGQFTLQVAGFQDRWYVRVIDQGGSSEPHICELPPIETVDDIDKLDCGPETGRGLAMVAAVSSSWGVLGDQTSRAVWAEILMPAKAKA